MSTPVRRPGHGAVVATVLALALVWAVPSLALAQFRDSPQAGATSIGTAALTAPSTVDSAPCSPAKSVKITWSSVPLATSYSIENSLNGGAFTSVQTVAAPAVSTTINKLPAGSHLFRVFATRGSWTGPATTASAPVVC